MDKILSARVDESVLMDLTRLSHKLRATKKKILETAIRHYVKEVEEKGGGQDSLQASFGAWKRKESAQSIREHSRKTMNENMRRLH